MAPIPDRPAYRRRYPDAGPRLRSILGLARSHKLTAYDAAYLELAMRLGLPLAARDDALEKAAQAVGVTLFTPPGTP